jgi:hypothetical protein
MDRAQMVQGLIQREEAANESYLTSQMDSDTWTKELQEVDEKLAILGLRMVFRPWEGHVTSPKQGF